MVDNRTAETVGETNFLIPNLGLRMEKTSEISTTTGSFGVEGNLAGAAGTSDEDATELGRLYVDTSWMVIQWGLNHSVYLEPLLVPSRWNDPNEDVRLVNEVAASVRGQWAGNYRLIPQAEEVIGGFYTVRGYDESVAAGDTVYMGSLEYRLHVPRSFRIKEVPEGEEPPEFKFAPMSMRGRPDWDLILKAFIDAGRTINNGSLPIEHDETLIGAGPGLELQIKRSANIRCDYGFSLNDLRSEDSTPSGRLHVSVTLLW